MKKNVGKFDKVVRIIMALSIVTLYLTDIIKGITAIILLALAGIFLLTSAISFCPLYIPFKISSRKKQ